MSSRILIHGLFKTILLYLDLNPLQRVDYLPNLENVKCITSICVEVPVYKWNMRQITGVITFTKNCIDLNLTDVSSQICTGLSYIKGKGECARFTEALTYLKLLA